MTPNLVLIEIPALDLDRASRFYSAVLHRNIQKEDVDGAPTGMILTADGGQQGCIVMVKDFNPSTDAIMLCFNVNGRLREAVAAARAKGGAVQQDIHSICEYGFRAEVLDSEGNSVSLHSETDE